MKEKFERRLMWGDINVKCKFQDGSVRTWQAKKEDVIDKIIEVVERYERIGYSLTLRQLHYQFVGHVPGYVNHDTAYKKLGKILDDCRYMGLIDWDNITDRGRKPLSNYIVRDPAHALQDAIDTYCLDRQDNQDIHVEVWTEKDALSEIFARSTRKYGITLCINKGYTSSSAIYKAYNRFTERMNRSQEVVILYFGDHDPSGLDMIRDIEDRLCFMLNNGDFKDQSLSDYFNIIPIGLTMKQIRQYKLPPNPTKSGDSRTPAYTKKFGKTCWEVDALAPEVLTQILEENILGYINSDSWINVIEQEKKDKTKLRSFIKTLK